MQLEKWILNMVLSFFSVFLRLVKVNERRVTFISLTSKELNGDFKKIYNELKHYPNLEICLNLVKFKKTLWGDFLYFLNCIKQLFLINTSKVVILNNNNYIVSRFKKSSVKVVQIWHACGAIKKFGNEVSRQYPISNYDYVLATSLAWQDIYARSFNVEKEQILPLGLPRTDLLFDANQVTKIKYRMLNQYPEWKGKYIILYAPTFRGNIIDGLHYDTLDLDQLIRSLPDHYLILSRMHPLLKDVFTGHHDRVVNVNNESLNSLLCVADCLITDYSSLAFDYAILNKKMVFYLPDLKRYSEDIGLNLMPEELPGQVCYDMPALVRALMDPRYDADEIESFKNKYFAYQDGRNAKRIAEFIAGLVTGRNE